MGRVFARLVLPAAAWYFSTFCRSFSPCGAKTTDRHGNSQYASVVSLLLIGTVTEQKTTDRHGNSQYASVVSLLLIGTVTEQKTTDRRGYPQCASVLCYR